MRLLRSRKTTLEAAPGPSPWYLRNEENILPGYSWRSAGDGAASSGKTLLVGQSGPVAVLNFYNYVMPLDTQTLLVWHQRHVESGPTAPVLLTILRPSLLPPLSNDLELTYQRMNEQQTSFHIAGETTSQSSIPTSVSLDQGNVAFPPEVKQIEELLILVTPR